MVNRIGIFSGGQELSLEKLSPTQQRLLEKKVEEIRALHPGYQETTCRIDMSGVTAKVFISGIEAEVPDRITDSLHRNIGRFFQNTGHLTREGLGKESKGVKEQTDTFAQRIQESMPGTSDSILAGTRLTDESMSVARNMIYAKAGSDPVATTVADHLGYAAGSLWSFFAAREVYKGVQEYRHAESIGDAEGGQRAQTRIISGSLVTTASVAYLSSKVVGATGAATAAAATMSFACAFFGVGSLLAMAASFSGALRCYRFGRRLMEYVEHPNLSDVEKYRGALLYLKDHLSVTAEEIAEIRKNSQSDDEINEKIRNLAEVKMRYMKRRTSNKSLVSMAEQIDTILERLNNSETKAQGIDLADKLIKQVHQDNQSKMGLFILGFIASLLSFIGLIVSTFFSGGTAPFILYLMAAVLGLGSTLANWGLEAIEKIVKKLKSKKEVPPCPVTLSKEREEALRKRASEKAEQERQLASA